MSSFRLLRVPIEFGLCVIDEARINCVKVAHLGYQLSLCVVIALKFTLFLFNLLRG